MAAGSKGAAEEKSAEASVQSVAQEAEETLQLKVRYIQKNQ